MKRPHSPTHLVALIAGERTRLEKLLESIPPERLNEPGVTGEWSVAQMVAHLIDWELYVVSLLEAGARDEAPAFRAIASDADIQRINAEVIRLRADDTPQQILADFQASFWTMLGALSKLTTADLFDPARRERFMDAHGHQVWEYVGLNTYEHYREHRLELENWLACS